MASGLEEELPSIEESTEPEIEGFEYHSWTVNLPEYLYLYLEEIAQYNDMSIDQVLSVIVHQMYAADMLSGVPTDFDHRGGVDSVNPHSIEEFLQYVAEKQQSAVNSKAHR